jgi:16S rRNA (uracil1498-N3)-methyltransferase
VKERAIRIPRLYHPAIETNDPLVLAGDDAHYLGHVLRARPGMEIETFDGAGGIARWKIVSITRREVRLTHLASEKLERRAPVRLILGLNPLKAGNEDFAVRMAAAMEVTAILPVIFARSEIPLDEATLKRRIDRWRRLCTSEVASSGGAYVPDIPAAVGLREAIEATQGRGVLFDEVADPVGPEHRFSVSETLTALVGPEGGLEREEVEFARENGYEIASLGPWTLKAELAGALAPSWVYSRVGE